MTETIEVYHVDIDDELIRKLKRTGELVCVWDPDTEDENPMEVVLHYDGNTHRITGELK